MKKTIASALTLGLASASFAASPAAAHEGHVGPHVKCCNFEQTTEARMGDYVFGYFIPGYIFVKADLDNDGVLRGKELRRARKLAIQRERGGSDRLIIR